MSYGLLEQDLPFSMKIYEEPISLERKMGTTDFTD
jgi:hypothetical protein